MSDWKRRKFWKSVTTESVDGGFSILLDGRSVKTPAKSALIVPTQAMATEMAREWDAQGDIIDPATMPITRAANSAIDKIVPQFDEVADIIAAYGDSDLLCYRAAEPRELTQRQAAAWDPLLHWAETALNAPLLPITGVMHQPQPAASLQALQGQVTAMSPFELAGLHDLVAMSGSLVIGLAAAANHMAVSDLWALSRIDEDWQIEQWGVDEEAAELAERKRGEFIAAHHFLTLSRVG